MKTVTSEPLLPYLSPKHSAVRPLMFRPDWRLFLVLLLLVVLPASTGCVRRRLTVRSFPAGAQVFVDDQEIGTTPCSASYVYYGTRKITLMKDGYRTETLWQTFDPPWYQIPPLDFVSENLIVREIRDERIVDVQLVPQEIVPQQKLLDRAQLLRDSAQTGAITPLLDLKRRGDALPLGEPEKIGLPGQGLPGGEPIPYQSLPGATMRSEPLPYPALPNQQLPNQPFPAHPLPYQPLPPAGGLPQGSAPPAGAAGNFGGNF